MANFRCERLYVVLDEPIPGLDHMAAVDPVEFAWHLSDGHADQAGLTPLGDFTFAPSERPRWRPAAEGLRTVRGLTEVYRGWIARGQNPYGYAAEVLAKKIGVLGQVGEVLAVAESRDRQFYLAAKDLA